jgi:DNA polymerase-3 subunit delta'
MIVGGDTSTRKSKALEVAARDSSKFDTTIFDSSETRGIGDIRELRPRFSRSPFESNYQTFLIFEAQNLTLEAQNALLKNLEEPTSSTKFILTAPTRENLLSTVTSRCTIFNLPINESPQNNLDFLKSYLEMDLYDRYQKAEKLDLDLWTAGWRKLLLRFFETKKKDAISNKEKGRIINYIKLVSKLRKVLRRNASSKLVKLIILLETPQISI